MCPVYRQLRSDTQSRIVIGLGVNLFLLNLVVIAGADQTHHRSLCTTVAIAMHYFLLSAFGWMTVEAYHLYLKLIKVFNSSIGHFIRKATFLAQGMNIR